MKTKHWEHHYQTVMLPFLKNSNEGSFFDGPNFLEELKDEQERLLLRQMGEVLLRRNVRTAGKTFHTERA